MEESELGNGGFHWFPNQGLDSPIDLNRGVSYGYAKNRTYIGVRKMLPVTHRTHPWLAMAFDTMVNDCDVVVNYAELKEGDNKRHCLTIGVLTPVEFRPFMRTMAADMSSKFSERLALGVFSPRSSLRCTYIGEEPYVGTVDQWHFKFTGKVNAQDKNFRELARLFQHSFYTLEDKTRKVSTKINHTGKW
jgi:hypothetical protein